MYRFNTTTDVRNAQYNLLHFKDQIAISPPQKILVIASMNRDVNYKNVDFYSVRLGRVA